VPEQAPQTKLAAIERLGARTTKLPFDDWWRVLIDHIYEPMQDRAFIHPVSDAAVIAGNGTIGLEILEDLPAPDAVLIPWGGGGLTVGIASAIKALAPEVRIYAVEPETAAPLAASLRSGSPQEIEYVPSFVDGAGGRALLPKMWRLARPLVDGAFTASLDETAAAVRFLAERARVVAEGAGALAAAAALSGRAGGGKLVCVVSGGNIDFSTLTDILEGRTP
jgi:threonine dehydratase